MPDNHAVPSALPIDSPAGRGGAEKGVVALARRAKTLAVPPVLGRPEGASFCLVTSGVQLPPGGAGYVAERLEGGRVRLLGYVDQYGRAWETDEPLESPPAQPPAVQAVRYNDASDVAGCIMLAEDDGSATRAAEFVERGADLFDVVHARVAGGEVQGVSMAMMCSYALIAFYRMPRRAGVALSSLDINDISKHLATHDVFKAVDGVVGAVEAAAKSPLLAPQGLALYLARMLRAAGLVGKSAEDLAVGGALDEEAMRGRDAGRALGVDASGATGDAALLAEDPASGSASGFAPAAVSDSAPDVTSDSAPDPAFTPDPEDATEESSSRTVPVPLVSMGDLPGLQAALQSMGIVGLSFAGFGDGAPKVPDLRLVRTSAYAGTYYVGFDPEEVGPAGARALLETESALNRFLLMLNALDERGLADAATEEECSELDLWLVDNVVAEAWPYVDGTVERAKPAPADASGVDVRLAFARGCESLRVPYRLEYRFRLDVAGKVLAVDATCPSALLMPRVAWRRSTGVWETLDVREREGMAARYALHLAFVLAAVGFWAGPRVERVVVNAWRNLGASESLGMLEGVLDGDSACVVSLDADRAWLMAALSDEAGRARCAEDPFGFAAGARHRFALDASWRLKDVGAILTLDDPLFVPDEKPVMPDVDERSLPERGRELLGAERVCDLGIYEDAARKAAGEAVAQALETQGEEAAQDAVRDVHDRSENLLLRDACLRVSEGIASGALGEGSSEEIAGMLSDIYGLQARMRAAMGLVRSDPRSARGRLVDIVDLVEDNGWFRDTPERRYCYFDSYASRALYSLRCGDGRAVRLLPDEYYLGYHRLSSLLSDSIDSYEAAVDYAARCVELAPSVAAGYLRLARSYFCVFDYRGEIETLKRMLRIAWSPTDIGMALYWMGYAYWMCGEPEVGRACYQRSVAYDRNLADPVAAELADFMRKKKNLADLTLPDDEVNALLREAGVDLGLVDENVAFLVRAAGIAADAGSLPLARILFGSAAPLLHDDAAGPTIDSLYAGE